MQRAARWLFVCLLCLGFAVTTSAQVTVSYFGHSCFSIQDATGGSILMIDPYATYLPYPGLPQPADVVLMTHGHIDHCPMCFGERNRITGEPIVVESWNSQGRIREGDWEIAEDITVRFTEASHVTASGGGAGMVALISFEIGGIRFAHLGDLGRTLTNAQIEALGNVDVLFLPVGGAFTIDAVEALLVVAQLPSVKLVIPMHFNVSGITPWPDIAPLSDFTDAARAQQYEVVEQENDQIEISVETLPERVEVWVLDYAR